MCEWICSKLSCYNLCEPYCRLSLTDVWRAVITADLDTTQHHSSCYRTAESKWLQGDQWLCTVLWLGSIYCMVKDKHGHTQTHMVHCIWRFKPPHVLPLNPCLYPIQWWWMEFSSWHSQYLKMKYEKKITKKKRQFTAFSEDYSE